MQWSTRGGGKKTCPGDASVVYTGYTASSHYTHTGSGKNYICLADNPEWGNVNPASQQYVAYLYAVQFAIGSGYTNNQPFSWENFGNKDPDLSTVPCVVCDSPNDKLVMIPGRQNCPADWYAEYGGFLGAYYYANASGSEWICVDKAPEPHDGTAPYTAAWQGQVHTAEVICGVLPCDTYKLGYEVSCVVCTK